MIEAGSFQPLPTNSPSHLQQGLRQGRWRAAVPAAAAALLGLCLVAAFVGAGPTEAAPSAILDLDARRRPFSVAPHAAQSKVLKRLWTVERILVDAQVCQAATPAVASLQRQRWPNPYAGKAPTISKVMYINLQWDGQRRIYMEQQLYRIRDQVKADRGQELVWERFPAVGKYEMEHQAELSWWRDRGFSQASSPDVRGDWSTAACAYSHYSAISTIPENDDGELVLITEDDVDIDPKFLDMWERMWPFVPSDWDVLRVGWFSGQQNCSQVVNAHVDRAGWLDPRNGECAYCGAQAYIVNPRNKDRVLKRFELARMTHADELLGAPTPQLEDPSAVPEINAYVMLPMLASIAFNEEGVPEFGSDRIDGRKVLVAR